MKFKLYGKKVTDTDQAQSDLAPKISFQLAHSRSAVDDAVQIEVEEDDIVELTFSDETVWLLPSEEFEEILQEQNPTRSGSRGDSSVLEVPMRLSAGTTSRGLVKDLILKGLSIFASPAVKITVQWTASSIESRIIPDEGLFYLDHNFNLQKDLESDSEKVLDNHKPILLFIHGTGSSTEGSFGKIRDKAEWSALWKKYHGQVMAFEHFTLSKSPIQNVLDLIPLLPDGKPIHLVTHSRGGIVGDFLARAAQGSFTESDMQELKDSSFADEIEGMKAVNKLLEKKKFVVERYVRVACPSQGTRLMAERLDVFLNVILNLITSVTGASLLPPVQAIKELLLAVVKQRANPEVLPGLAAMKPGTPFQALLNSTDVALESPLSVIAGNAEAGNWSETLAFFLTRMFFWEQNDWVVDTDSMFSGFKRHKPVHYRLFSSPSTNHISYFEQEGSLAALQEALNTPSGTTPSGFKDVEDSKFKTRGVLFPNGNIEPIAIDDIHGSKPVVVLVPGIMGSNLALNDEEIWISYRKIAAGNLMNLTLGNNRQIEATSLVESPYGKLVKYLEKSGYDVVVFPYDWRLSTAESGEGLAKKIKEIRDEKSPPSIQVVAHSMGGLVARAMMWDEKYQVWPKLQQQQGPALVMLGTPWHGSYLIPQTLTGYAKTIRSLAKLSLGPKKRDLLSVFSKYKGLYDLLPLRGHDWGDKALWEALQEFSDQNQWVLPTERELRHYREYRKMVADQLAKTTSYEKIIYIAGYKKQTIDNISIEHAWSLNKRLQTYDTEEITALVSSKTTKDNYELAFTTTSQGDGSVSWRLGVPRKLSEDGEPIGEPLTDTYFQKTEHGELANDEKYFDALLDILQKGKTKELPLLDEERKDRKSRSVGREEESNKPAIASIDILADSNAGLISDILGMAEVPRYEDNTRRKKAIEVVVKMGHLKYANYPILIGHFREQSLRGAEYVLDSLLEGELRKRHELGNYPGNPNTNLVLLSDGRRVMEAVVVGLGSPEDLNPLQLTLSVEHACREYIIQAAKSIQPPPESLGLSPLLIGTAYGTLSLSGAVNAILEGVSRANAKVQNLNNNRRDKDTPLPYIEKVEFVEIYRDKAMQTFYLLDQIERENNVYAIRFDRKLHEVQGSRDILRLAAERNWWMRLNIRSDRDYESGQPIFRYSASTGHARVSNRTSTVDPKLIHKLLDASNYKMRWNRSLSKTLFELLVPNEFKLSFRNQHNILMILDAKTASYPWELLHFEEESGDPLCVRTGFIRQFATSYDRPIIKPIHQLSALVIGDPQLSPNSRLPQLPGAKKEAIKVANLLKSDGFIVDLLTEQSYAYIMNKFFEEYKVLHIASHGVIDYYPENEEDEDDCKNKNKSINKRTGILLDDGIVLDPAVIAQRSSTPELVFVNCCHLGAVDAEKEAYTQSRHRLAANIGTEFINMGVKAVVVAGWEVDDSAAETFATVFYQQMLLGLPFGRAVKEARERCYRRFPSTHTWGAYQCYGDESYQLITRQGASRKRGRSYLLEPEAIIDLEKLLDETRSVRKRHDNRLEEDLLEIMDAVEIAEIRSPEVVELEAQIYAEIGEYKKATRVYEELWTAKKATWSFRSLEQYYNVKLAALWMDWLAADDLQEQQDIHEKMFEPTMDLHTLLRLSPTAERLSLLGSAYKRLYSTACHLPDRPVDLPYGSGNYGGNSSYSMQTVEEIDGDDPAKMPDSIQKTYRQDYLDESIRFYNHARRMVPDPYLSNDYYALVNWLSVALFQSDAGSYKAYCEGVLSGQNVANYFNEQLDQLREKSENKAEFWDEVRLVNVLTVLLLDEKKVEQVEVHEGEIINHYRRAWRKGGSIRNRQSECFQMRFLLQAIKDAITQEKDKAPEKGRSDEENKDIMQLFEAKRACFERLVAFFEQKD